MRLVWPLVWSIYQWGTAIPDKLTSYVSRTCEGIHIFKTICICAWRTQNLLVWSAWQELD